MTLRLPQPKTKARFLLIGYGLILLFWMSLEDHQTVTVSVLGFGTALIYITTALMNRFHSQDLTPKFWIIAIILWGAVIGASSVLATAILMFFKSSWHGHISPDYPPEMILDMLSRLPIWTISGALFGLCLSSVLYIQHVSTDSQNLTTP